MNRSLAIASCLMCLTGNSVFAESAHIAGPKNLLPNASFELPLGQEKHQWTARDPGYGSPTNWTDMVNPLTLQLMASGQVSIGPPSETDPVIEEVPGTPEGSRAVAVSVSKNEPAHLTSPVVPMKYGQAYTLSVYARSDLPSAKLRLGVWNQPMDWRNEPDAQSVPISVTEDWQRYEQTFNVSPYFHRGAVDLVFESSTEGKVWIDAVQLEVGPHATPFQTRYPVEVALTADTPFSGMLHLMGEPLPLNLAHYSSREQEPGDLKLSIETLDEGKVVFTTDIACPTAAGFGQEKLAVDFSRVGNYRARVFSATDEEIGVSSYGYMFTVHPVMKDGLGGLKPGPEEEDFQGILYSRDGKVHELPAERVRLPLYSGEGSYNFTITDKNLIYLMAATRKNDDAINLMRTKDGGRTWDVLQVTRRVHTVLRDGSFLSWDHENDHLLLYRSRDEGQTWERLGSGLGPLPSGPQAGPITQLRDGTLLWPVGLQKPGVNHVTYTFRSTDGGQTWSEGYPVCPTGEPSVIELTSGRLLAVVRDNLLHPPAPSPAPWQTYLEEQYEPANRLWMMQYGQCKASTLTSVVKNILLADSDNGGVIWTNVRAATTGLAEMHGSAVELPDGRIVLMYIHRVPWLRGGVRARVSSDGGNTWDPETYYLSTVETYPEYSTDCVLPPELADGKPGMILSVVGDRPRSVKVDRTGLMQAVRWRPLP